MGGLVSRGGETTKDELELEVDDEEDGAAADGVDEKDGKEVRLEEDDDAAAACSVDAVVPSCCNGGCSTLYCEWLEEFPLESTVTPEIEDIEKRGTMSSEDRKELKYNERVCVWKTMICQLSEW